MFSLVYFQSCCSRPSELPFLLHQRMTSAKDTGPTGARDMQGKRAGGAEDIVKSQARQCEKLDVEVSTSRA